MRLYTSALFPTSGLTMDVFLQIFDSRIEKYSRERYEGEVESIALHVASRFIRGNAAMQSRSILTSEQLEIERDARRNALERETDEYGSRRDTHGSPS